MTLNSLRSKVTSIELGNGVTSIPKNAFSNCVNLEKITIPSSVKTIGDNAFYYCYKLSNVSIPNSVTSIGKYAFQNCINLEEVYISDSVIRRHDIHQSLGKYQLCLDQSET